MPETKLKIVSQLIHVKGCWGPAINFTRTPRRGDLIHSEDIVTKEGKRPGENVLLYCNTCGQALMAYDINIDFIRLLEG
jgi:hypothetical protein